LPHLQPKVGNLTVYAPHYRVDFPADGYPKRTVRSDRTNDDPVGRAPFSQQRTWAEKTVRSLFERFYDAGKKTS
jgi:hypothetical protein